MPDASKPMTPSASAGASAPVASDWLAGASPRVRAMSAELQTRLFAFGSGVSARIGRRHAVYSVHGRVFVSLFPQGVRLRLLLNLKRGELEDPDGIARCTAGRSHEGQGDWQIDVADGRDLERAMPLVRQAFKTAEKRT